MGFREGSPSRPERKFLVETQTVLVLLGLNDEQNAQIQAAAPDWEFLHVSREEVTDEQLARAQVILGNPRPQQLQKAHRLRWVQLSSAGTDMYAATGALPDGVILTSATGSYGPAISEHLLAMTLALMKDLPLYRDNQRGARAWAPVDWVRYVEGSTVLILGLGDIGGAYARKMKALGATVIGVRRVGADRPDYLDELHHTQELDALLPRADVLAMALPNTPATQGIMSRERLARMKPSAILLNVGRGNAVDTGALCDALASGALGGAGLDVTDPEPLPPDHPLWDQPKALITPHMAGRGERSLREIVRICAENLAAYRAGKPMQSVFDPATGYRRL